MENYLSNNLRILRRRANKSQAALANTLELTRNKVASYEYDQARPSLEVLRRYSEHFQVSIDDMINRNLADERELLAVKSRSAENPIASSDSDMSLDKQVYGLNSHVLKEFVQRNQQIEKMVQGFKAFRQIRGNDDRHPQGKDGTVGEDNLVYLLEHLIKTNRDLINSLQNKL